MNGSDSSCTECDSVSSGMFLWVNDKKTACDQPAGSLNINTNSGKAVWVISSINIAVLTFTIGKNNFNNLMQLKLFSVALNVCS